jgi:hypothetical protein
MQKSIEISILKKMYDDDTNIDNIEFGGFDQVRDYLLENGVVMPGLAPAHEAGVLTAYLIDKMVFCYFVSPEIEVILPMSGLTEEQGSHIENEKQFPQSGTEQSGAGSKAIITVIIFAILGFIWKVVKAVLFGGSSNAGGAPAGNYSSSSSNRKQIGSAVDRGGIVYVYDEMGHQICGLPRGNGPCDGLKGYTSGTVSIRRGSILYTYNAQGHQIFAGPASSPSFNR